jgi:outer membrane autotransporter protein
VPPALVHSGEYFAVSSGLYGTDLPAVASESPLVSWTAGKNASGALVLGATVADATTLPGLERNSAAAINGLLGADGSDEAVAALGGRVQNIDEIDELAELGEALGPNTEGADTELALTTIETITDALSERFSVFEGGEGDEGGVEGTSVWLQPFGIWTTEDEYDGRTGGVILGVEGAVTDEASLGLALAYAESDTRNTEEFSTDVSTFAAAVYGGYDLSPVILNASLGIAFQDFDTVRIVELEPATESADGSHDGTHLFGRIDAAYPIEVGAITVAPVASLFVAKLWQDGYREDAAGGIGLSVDDEDTTSVQSGLGFAVEIPLVEDTSEVSLEIEAKWQHEFGDSSRDITANFAGGPSFSVSTEVEDRDSAELGIGLEFAAQSGWAASAGYEAEVGSEGVSSQQAVLKVGYTF